VGSNPTLSATNRYEFSSRSNPALLPEDSTGIRTHEHKTSGFDNSAGQPNWTREARPEGEGPGWPESIPLSLPLFSCVNAFGA
jgi:hypothetical protein